MNFHILTLFPEMVDAGLHTSILGRAAKAGYISIHTVNFRAFTKEKHGHVDDAPFGGGAGMVLMCQPVYDAWKSVCEEIEKRRFHEEQEDNPSVLLADPPLKECPDTERTMRARGPRVLYTSPAGKVFDQQMARELAREEDLILLCGHYEGIDQRVLELIGAEEVSIGDYVLTGGELPAMVMVDAISRMVPGVLSNADSGEDESFSVVYPNRELTKRVRRQVYGSLLSAGNHENGKKHTNQSSPNENPSAEPPAHQEPSFRLLEYPQYTRPVSFMGLEVPEVLLSGDHARILAWRREQSIRRTRERRPDLLP